MPKIGLEIHGYLLTDEKLFCTCKAQHGLKHAVPNTNICPVCTGQPGTKPLLPNKTAINKAIQTALVLKNNINKKLPWQRKHYNWPDLPKGYQNTLSGTYAMPIGQHGKFLDIKITECHLEEDPAAWNPKTGEIDYNKSGSPLIEIVTEPDFKSSKEVEEWLRQLLTTLSYMKIIDKSLGIKADVNVSLPEIKGPRIEVKNVNSIKNIKKAIEYEIQRQKKNPNILISRGQETRMFDAEKGITIKMRSKEKAQDYRFISDPDLPVLNISEEKIKSISKNLPETPFEKLKKIIKKYKISPKEADVLTKRLEIVEFFEKVVSSSKIKTKLATKWIIVELLSVLNYNKKELDSPEIEIKPEHFVELVKLVQDKKITELKAQEILRQFIPKSFNPEEKLKNQTIISSKKEIELFCNQAIKENTLAVKDYKSGKKESLNFLIGQVMKLSKKRADFKTVREILERLLK